MTKPRTEAARRNGRGRLSTIDMLPEEADEDIAWVNEQLRENKRPQNELLDVFNMRLAARGFDPISKSAFSRYSVRKTTQFRRLDETRCISAELVEMLGTTSADQTTIAVAEMAKNAAFALFEKGGLNSKDIMELARANQAAVGAQKTSAEYRRSLEEEIRKQIASDVGEVVDKVGKARGFSAATREEIIAEIMGVVRK